MATHKYLSLKKPCGNCPFRKEGAIDLAPGRFQQIIVTLVSNDTQSFHCHKTVKRDDDGESIEHPGLRFCAGAMIYLEKIARPSVIQRVGRVLKIYDYDTLMENADLVVDVPPIAKRT